MVWCFGLLLNFVVREGYVCLYALSFFLTLLVCVFFWWCIRVFGVGLFLNYFWEGCLGVFLPYFLWVLLFSVLMVFCLVSVFE